ncbi:hypothetical protein ACRALDRAFT_1073900 [Sodiomyces alcalophilus JCM 7366]|uniref:uncharacterized protein n=1 Tax=Sodiomyces alcalophilus JCM 7366 TaxID=591952 RepID=UPI0039B68DF6
MVQMYTIAGRQVGSHYLAMGILGALFGGIYTATRGGGSKAPATTPPINASSPGEADFIKNFLDEADKGKKDAKQ